MIPERTSLKSRLVLVKSLSIVVHEMNTFMLFIGMYLYLTFCCTCIELNHCPVPEKMTHKKSKTISYSSYRIEFPNRCLLQQSARNYGLFEMTVFVIVSV